MKNRYKQTPENGYELLPQLRQRIREALFLFTVGCALFLFVSLLTYQTSDPGWSSSGISKEVNNWGGHVGAWIADVLLILFGIMGYVFPLLIITSSWVNLRKSLEITSVLREKIFKFIGFLLFISSGCALINFYLSANSSLPAHSGGIIGQMLDNGLTLLFNKAGTSLVLITAFLCGITFLTGFSWVNFIEKIGAHICEFFEYLRAKRELAKSASGKITVPEAKKPDEIAVEKNLRKTTYEQEPAPLLPARPMLAAKLEVGTDKKKLTYDAAGVQLKAGSLPPLTLLNPTPPLNAKAFSNISFEDLSQLVEQRLLDFGVAVRVVAVHPGPVITRFELELAPGVKVSKISGLAKDVARSLSTVSVRIVEVIPGKSVIGLEIPNENRELVTLRDLLDSQRYIQSRSPVSLILGKDISGNPVVVDLAKMPHLLVAGTTGSGKSVSLNAMLLSMLFKATPEQLRLILIDPKMLELSVYDGIPHLLTPVITDMKDAANALRWCVAEMDKRYRLMAALGVRNIAGYNQKVNDAIKQGNPIPMPGVLVTDETSAREHLKPLPIIVVIADELADMMMVVGKKVEDLIARIAQKARASGIHLILATQRPSVDVITGLIKANIPTRIAFQVSSRIDSRTILDQQGAEQLLGHGDMLYLPPGVGVPVRVHGAYVADEEVHRVVAAWRSSGNPEYCYDVTEGNESNTSTDAAPGDQDPLYDEAVRIVMESKRASISLVQRRLRIGYNRAARMMEDMETAGIVSSMDHSGSREVLVGDIDQN